MLKTENIKEQPLLAKPCMDEEFVTKMLFDQKKRSFIGKVVDERNGKCEHDAH